MSCSPRIVMIIDFWHPDMSEVATAAAAAAAAASAAEAAGLVFLR